MDLYGKLQGIDRAPACVRAVEDAAALLRELGQEVVEEHPPFDGEQFGIDFVYMLVGETAADVAELEAVAGRRARVGELEKETMVLARLGAVLPARDFALAVRRIKRVGRDLAGFFAGHDLLLTPTLARAPVQVGELESRRAEAAMLDAVRGDDPGAPYTAPAPARSFLAEVGAPPGRLRSAYTTRALIPTRERGRAPGAPAGR